MEQDQKLTATVPAILMGILLNLEPTKIQRGDELWITPTYLGIKRYLRMQIERDGNPITFQVRIGEIVGGGVEIATSITSTTMIPSWPSNHLEIKNFLKKVFPTVIIDYQMDLVAENSAISVKIMTVSPINPR